MCQGISEDLEIGNREDVIPLQGSVGTLPVPAPLILDETNQPIISNNEFGIFGFVNPRTFVLHPTFVYALFPISTWIVTFLLFGQNAVPFRHQFDPDQER